MEDLQKIDQLIVSGKLEDAVAMLDTLINNAERNDNNDYKTTEINAIKLAELYFRRGKLMWRMGNRSRATADYTMAVHYDPESPARHALIQAQEVADFFNHDLYNP